MAAPKTLNKPQDQASLGISSIGQSLDEINSGVLGLFDKVPMDYALKKAHNIEILPQNPLQQDAPIELESVTWRSFF